MSATPGIPESSGASTLPPVSLDTAVAEALAAIRSAGTPDPDVLIFAATGVSGLLDDLEAGVKLSLKDVAGCPSTFLASELFAGTLTGPASSANVWIMEDAPEISDHDPAWARAFPIWVASAAGAKFLIHTSAGTTLDAVAHPVESVVRASDHINLSGTTPLLGLGKSRLGPLFPDQTRLHDADLARIADAAKGARLSSGIVACTTGPALATPAELRSYASAGASIAVQRLSDPLIAAAHAGLGTLALTAAISRQDEQVSVASLVERSTRVAPALDALVKEVASAAGPLASARRKEAAE